MTNLIKKLVKDERGQDMAEYGIALAVITVAVGTVVGLVGTDVTTIWTKAQTTLAGIAA
jgi:Flp pilus assembly pilin Flp